MWQKAACPHSTGESGGSAWCPQEAACPHATGMYLLRSQPLAANPPPSLPRRQGTLRLLLDPLGPLLMNLTFTGVSLKLPTKPFPHPRLVGTRQHALGGPHHAARAPSRGNLAREGVSRPCEAWAHLLRELQTPPTPVRILARLPPPSHPRFPGTATPTQAQGSAGRATPGRQVWGRGWGPPEGPVAARARSGAPSLLGEMPAERQADAQGLSAPRTESFIGERRA